MISSSIIGFVLQMAQTESGTQNAGVTLAQLTLRLPPDSRYVLLMADKDKAAVGAQLQTMSGGWMFR